MANRRLNPTQNPMYVDVPDAPVSTQQVFVRTISQPADGSSFTVLLPNAQPNASYGVQATLGKVSVFVHIAVDPASQTASQFTCTTDIALGDGDSINFTVEALS